MNIFKKVFLILAVISIPILVSGCSSRTTTTTDRSKVFTIWAFDDEDVWKPIIRDLQKDLSGYEIKYVKKELNDSYENDALNSILSGQGPDVWAIPNDWIYRHKDKLAPMPQDLIDENEIDLDKQFVPAIKESVYIGDKIYALSPTVDTLMIYYNNNMFDKAYSEYSQTHKGDEYYEARKEVSSLLNTIPITWENITKASNLITQKSGNEITRSGIALGTASNIGYSEQIFYALMIQNETQMVSDDLQTAVFNLPQDTSTGNQDIPAKRALDFYTSFADPDSSNYSWNPGMGSDIEAFVDGKVAMIIGLGDLKNYFAQVYPSFRYQIAPFPQIGNDDTNIKNYTEFISFAVPQASSHIEAAWSSIINLSSDNANSYSSAVDISSPLKRNGYEPSLKDLEGSTNPGNYQNQTSSTFIKGRYPDEFDKLINTAIDETVNGSQSSQSALDKAANNITTILRREGW